VTCMLSQCVYLPTSARAVNHGAGTQLRYRRRPVSGSDDGSSDLFI
jgi:hypothetical protein